MQAKGGQAALCGPQVNTFESFHVIGWFEIDWFFNWFAQFSSISYPSDLDFVPEKRPVKPKPTLHPILENRSFPPQDVPLSVMVGFPSKKRQSVINTLTRKSMKAVFNHPYGKGVNPQWAKKVPAKELKLPTSLTLVGNMSSFSLSQFIPWDGMMGVGDNFCGGPNSQRFLLPDVYWPSFQVDILCSTICLWTNCTNVHMPISPYPFV